MQALVSHRLTRLTEPGSSVDERRRRMRWASSKSFWPSPVPVDEVIRLSGASSGGADGAAEGPGGAPRPPRRQQGQPEGSLTSGESSVPTYTRMREEIFELVVVDRRPRRKPSRSIWGAGTVCSLRYGHVRDLPPKDGSVDPDQGFEMLWQVSPDRSKQLKAIADEAKKADTLILATDPDREGEAISWHVQEVLRQKKALPADVQRVTFNAITSNAVTEAMKNPRGLDEDLIDAYRARRALDYSSASRSRRSCGGSFRARSPRAGCSPWLCGSSWTASARSRSSNHRNIGRSVRRSRTDGQSFVGRLVQLDGKKIERLTIGSKSEVDAAKAAVEAGRFTVASVETKPFAKEPATAVHDVDAAAGGRAEARLLGESHDARCAGLYEDGLITYMRTDGVDMAAGGDQRGRKGDHQPYDDRLSCPTGRASIRARSRTRRKRTRRCVRPTSRARLARPRATTRGYTS